jgi:transposase
MQKNYIIGVDVSKDKLDIHCHSHYESLVVSNDEKGFQKLLKWILQEVSNELSSIGVVMEYTGIYTYRLEHFLHQVGIDYVKRPALDIKRSAGLKRGKTDKADARMISRYGWQRREELCAMKPLSNTQQNLQQLMAYRDKLVADRASYQTRITEMKGQMGGQFNDCITCSTRQLIETLSDQIKIVTVSIEQVICSDKVICRNYQLLKSVTGIGFATAVHLLIVTENFNRFINARKFACYCGVAPFENSSGSSIRGKTKTSHLANKKLKSLFTMAAISAIQHEKDLKEKYHQKLQQGKAKMCALNIIRFKLIERIFAVIKRQSPYEIKVAA